MVVMAAVVLPFCPAEHLYCDVPASMDVFTTSSDCEGALKPVGSCTTAISSPAVTLVQAKGTIG